MNTTNRHLSRALPAFLACLATVGCDDREWDPSMLRDGEYQCPRWQCGSNVSEINGKSLQELHLGGQPNADGIALIGFTPPAGVTSTWTLDVDGDKLIARGQSGGAALSGQQLVGSTIWLQINGVGTVPVVISGYEEVDSWAANGEPVAAYALTYADFQTAALTRSVCKGTLVDPLQAAVVVLAGERYDLATKRVIPSQTNWITLACAGSAAAKMALLGYGPHAEFTDSSQPASVDQRQATLKMITSDYCGNGLSYTEDGTPLAWENQSGTVALASNAGELEAIWTEYGAVCLDVPRVVDREDVACSLPSCDQFSLDDGEWVTYLVD
jgi:hypothetical protein